MARVTIKCILNYVNLLNPKASVDGARPKFSASLLIPKSDIATKEKLDNTIIAAYNEGQSELKGNAKSVPPMGMIKLPLRDGDDKEDSVYAGNWFLNASSYTQPQLLSADGSPITDPSAIYSGILGAVSLYLHVYNVNGNRGITAKLNGVLKIADGPRLGGMRDMTNDFKEFLEK